MLVAGMQGLGDSIYQRSVLREIKERVYLRTSWPQMYADLGNIKPVLPNVRLRTQLKNISRLGANTWNPAPCLPAKRLTYNIDDLLRGSILETMERRMGVKPKVFDIPKFKGPEIKKPYAVIRPVTIRAEWRNYSRSCEPGYICDAADVLRDLGIYTVSVADIQQGLEWSPQLPDCDKDYNKGELGFSELMGLIQGAAVVVGSVGWIAPAAIAAGVPLILIAGGLGAFNAPEKVTGPPMDTSKTRWIFPDRYCRCSDMRHGCNKKITNFSSKFYKALRDLCLISSRKVA